MAATLDKPEIFQYNNEFFALGIRICDDKNEFTLNRNQIEYFEYVNEINTPWLEGKIVYIDTNSMIDKFIGSRKAVCMVNLNKVDKKKDGDIETYTDNLDDFFCHKFMIENIEPGHKEANSIKYTIYIKSEFYQEFNSIISYSNHKQGPETVTDIYKKLLGIRLISVASDSGKSSQKIYYITNGNSTLISSFDFLMNKLYYFQNHEDAIIFFVYDEIKREYRFVDLTKPDTYVKDIEKCPVKDITVSLFNGDAEQMKSAENQVNFGALVQQPLSESIRSYYNRAQSYFDRSKNEYIEVKTQSQSIMNYFNGKPVTNELSGTQEKDDGDIAQYNTVNETLDNNDTDVYFDQINNFMFNNGLIANSHGQINLRPGMLLTIRVEDRDLSQAQGESANEIEAL